MQPTNILLGPNFEPKLSDFGLCKVIDIGETYASSEVRGTFGYVDPEYQNDHRVNSSGDVFSFGVVLLQILSGKKVFNLNLEKPIPLNKMVSNPTLILHYNDEFEQHVWSNRSFVLNLTGQKPKKRWECKTICRPKTWRPILSRSFWHNIQAGTLMHITQTTTTINGASCCRPREGPSHVNSGHCFNFTNHTLTHHYFSIIIYDSWAFYKFSRVKMKIYQCSRNVSIKEFIW